MNLYYYYYGPNRITYSDKIKQCNYLFALKAQPNVSAHNTVFRHNVMEK